jgi:hypothetical protein
VALCLIGGLLSGCGEDTRTAADKRADTELVRTLNNIGVENAILTQHTLYPYHFIADSEKLNELGQRDFAVLARHFGEHPGILNVRQGDGIPPALYQARLVYVTSQLKEAGVAPGRVSISDGMPGGPGLRAEKVVTILMKGTELSAKPANGGTQVK